LGLAHNVPAALPDGLNQGYWKKSLKNLRVSILDGHPLLQNAHAPSGLGNRQALIHQEGMIESLQFSNEHLVTS
jgi:hypothetical protein